MARSLHRAPVAAINDDSQRPRDDRNYHAHDEAKRRADDLDAARVVG